MVSTSGYMWGILEGSWGGAGGFCRFEACQLNTVGGFKHWRVAVIVAQIRDSPFGGSSLTRWPWCSPR